MLSHQLVAMHTLHKSITACPLQSRAYFRVVQGLLGPVDVSTRMLYRHTMWATGVPSGQGCRVALLPKPAHLMSDVDRAK